MPFVSMSADRAAQQVVAACQFGDADSFIANYFNPPIWATQLAPALTQEVFEWINMLLLPVPGGIGQMAARGYESPKASPSWLTALQDQAAREYNQMRPRASEPA
jgi:hypothetical protein